MLNTADDTATAGIIALLSLVAAAIAIAATQNAPTNPTAPVSTDIGSAEFPNALDYNSLDHYPLQGTVLGSWFWGVSSSVNNSNLTHPILSASVTITNYGTSDYDIVVDWGDGTSSSQTIEAATVTDSIPENTRVYDNVPQITLTHTYNDDSGYTIEICSGSDCVSWNV